ncbi:hypothetical protein [Luteolibacter soli]|uniref:DUF2628 domain-containing protein n=1 Tax=Luteolibacter soli TaxID=3135280 RepID=A0ABU9AWL1_9BACT
MPVPSVAAKLDEDWSHLARTMNTHDSPGHEDARWWWSRSVLGAIVSPKVIYFLVVPLVLALVVHEVMTGTRAEAVLTIAVGIAFVGVQIAVAALPADEPTAPNRERRAEVPPEEF